MILASCKVLHIDLRTDSADNCSPAWETAMKKSPRRIHLKLSESAVHQLPQYALGATAAGVGMLALARPAEAKIVYTHADTPIPVNGGLIELDLNHDGV